MLGRQPVELVAEVLEVVVRLLRISRGVRLRLAGGGARKRPAESGERRSALLIGRIDLGAHVGLDRSEARQVRVEVVRALAQLTREVAQLLGKPCPRILGIASLVGQVFGDPIDPLGLSFGRLADLLLLGDHGVLWVREQRDGHEEERRQQGDGGRLAREPRSEQAGRRRADRAEGIAALAADESVGLGGLVGRLGRVQVRISRRRSCGTREGDGELERARHAVAERALRVDGERRLADPRAGSHPGDQPAEQTDQRDRSADDHRSLERHEPGHGPEHAVPRP